MARQQALVSWIGFTDLNAWADACPAEAEKILGEPAFKKALERFERKRVHGVGALKTAAVSERFDVIHLMSRIPELDLEFAKWLGPKVDIHRVKLDDPTDYRAVYLETDRVLRGIGSDNDLNFLLTSGTPTMAAVWVLLGKTIHQAALWQSFDGSLTQTELPFDLKLLELQVSKRWALAYSQAADSLPASFDPIIGSSPAIRDARSRAAIVARYDVCALLLGESGTGKELFAKAIHEASERRDCAYHAVNCAAIPGQLLESELFGHEKGAFTGAEKPKDGLFQLADKGTLFLDEVGECDWAMQAKLLRVLQPPADSPCQRIFRRVGGKADQRSDVRVIAATNRELLDMVSKGTFREDLYYRLASVTIRLPALRERQSDIPDIAKKLLSQIRRVIRPGVGKHDFTLSDEALRFAQTRRWKGNIRQLYNVLLQAAMFATCNEISRHDLEAAAFDVGEAPDSTWGFPFDGNLKDYLKDQKVNLYNEAMRRSENNQSRASKLLGVTPAAVSKILNDPPKPRRK